MKRLAFNGVCRGPAGKSDGKLEEKPFRLFIDREGERVDFDFLNYSTLGVQSTPRRVCLALDLICPLVYQQWLDGNRVPHFSIAWVGAVVAQEVTYLSISTTDYEKISILARWPLPGGELRTEAAVAYLDIKSQKLLRDLFEEVRRGETVKRTPTAGQ